MLVIIASLTLRASPPPAIPLPMLCLVCGDLGGVDVVLNVALFVPLGIALVVAGLSWPRAALVSALVSLGIESLQFSVVAGRDASISDLLTNTFGGTTGALLAVHWRQVARPRPDTARLLGAAAAAFAIAIMAGTAALLRPAIPAMGLWGQWTPQQLQFEPYHGTVRDFRVNDIEVPYNVIPESEPLRQRLLTGETRARVAFDAGASTARLAAIARVGSRVQEVMLLGARGTDFVFRTRLVVRDALLRVPMIALPEVLPTTGEAVVAEAGLRARHWYATVKTSQGTWHRDVPFAVSLGWTFLLPWDHPLLPGDEWFSAMWLAALAFPAAAWGALGGEGHAPRGVVNVWWGLSVTMLSIGLWAIPSLANFSPATALEWGGLVAGSVVGAIAAWPLRRWTRPNAISADTRW